MTSLDIDGVNFSLDIINNLGESELVLWLGNNCDKLVLRVDLERKTIVYNSFLSKSLCESISMELLSIYDRTTEEFTFRADSTSRFFNKKDDFKELEEF